MTIMKHRLGTLYFKWIVKRKKKGIIIRIISLPLYFVNPVFDYPLLGYHSGSFCMR